MMQELYVMLPYNRNIEAIPAGVLHAVMRQSDGSVINRIIPLNQLKDFKNEFVYLIIPVVSISWHYLKLPVGLNIKNNKRLKPALQGLLEDELLSEASEVHVALQPNARNGNEALVGVCDSSWLSKWLKVFEGVGIKISSIKPEITPDMAKGKIIVTRSDEKMLVSWFDKGFWVLPWEGEEIIFLPKVQRWATQNAVIDAQSAWGEDKVRLLTDERYIAALRRSEWDFAQHEFSSTSGTRLRRKVLDLINIFIYSKECFSSRLAITAFFLICGLGLTVKWMLNQHHLNEKKAIIAKTVKEVFPKLSLLVDPVVQMKREVTLLKESSGVLTNADFLPMLTVIGGLLIEDGDDSRTLHYKNKEIILKGVSPLNAKRMFDSSAKNGYEFSISDNEIRMRWGKNE